MNTLVLVPVSRFRVTYEVGGGTPFSKLDLLVVDAINAGAQTLATLQHVFGLPQRLVIEILVNLFHEGWIEMSARGFSLTEKGTAGLAGSVRPVSHRVKERFAVIMLERVTGGLTIQSIVTDNQKRLQDKGLWDEAVRLKVSYFDDMLDEGQVRPYLRRASGEWILNVDRPEMETKGWQWMRVQVDTVAGKVFGLPEQWVPRLRDSILAEAGAPQVRVEEEGVQEVHTIVDSGTRRAVEVTLNEEDVVVGLDAHRQYLADAIERARSSVLICSQELGPTDGIRDRLDRAMKRGVGLDLIWGASESQAGAVTFPWVVPLKEAAQRFQSEHRSELLRINELPADLSVNLLIYDTEVGWRAVVGSFPWLTDVHNRSLHVSIQVSDPALVSEICLSALGMMTDTRGRRLAGRADRWRSIAADLDRASGETREAELPRADSSRVRVVHNHDHVTRVFELQRTVQSRFAICGSTADDTATRHLAQMAAHPRRVSVPVVIACGSVDEGTAQRISDITKPLAGVVLQRPDLAANVVIGDTTTLVGSFSVLARSSGNSPRACTQIGLLIEGGSVADFLWESLSLEGAH